VPKRSFDFVAAAVLLLALAPVILLVALLIRVCMGAPVLFRQERPGRGGRPFMLYKFRTMQVAENAPGGAASKPLPDAQRLTPLGAALRRASLDELPQLFNVLRGDMSLVGPRPLLMEYLPLYSARQARRHEVLPGITGWAQVNGRNATSWPERFELDVWYVEHRSAGLDLKILWLTLARVFSGAGVSQPGQATMEKFRGSDR
jgi:lipopolysaccharide/colanic/teichoic acid biosynthesis glycosyltransferase